MVDGLHVHLSF